MRRSQQTPVSPARRALLTILSSVLIATALFQSIFARTAMAAPSVAPVFKLGNEVLFSRFHHLIEGRRVGLITNQTGVNSKGVSTIDALAADPTVHLTALYGPEHGIDGQAKAGAYVASYDHPTLGIPVYSLYGETRMPTEAMLKNIDVLLFDVQEIGARTYTYASTLNYAMKAAARDGKKVVVLDRPNPLGGVTVEGPVLDEGMETFVGVDNLPMAHGMTIGELARFYNREIGADLTVVPMEGYTRETIWQDTGLPWIPTSPLVKTVDSAFCYMATGLGEGTGIYQADFTWIGGKNIDSNRFAQLMNAAGIPGVTYVPEVVNGLGGVRLKITDYRTFNPVKSGLYALAYARQLVSFTVPKSGTSVCMFDKIQGTSRVGQWLEQKLSPQTMESRWQNELAAFKKLREKYLIYGHTPDAGLQGRIDVIVDNTHVFFDTDPYIDEQNRTMVPVRAIAEALGAEVTWDAVRYAVTIARNGRTVQLVIGSTVAKVNGEKLPMDTVPLLKDDRTMVPVRFVSEFLGADVDWDDPTRTVLVTQ
ncbi:MAG: exo-beta-N-acetylmuramidase NamZ domain-containing protein [Bacillota bacterium]